MNISLGPRLRVIAGFIPEGSRLADIGSDHGYLPAWLLLQRRVSRAIAGEINRDPARRAEETARELDLLPEMEIRLGDGLQVLQPDEVDAVVISGMGGSTIRQILAASPQVLAGLRRLVLQPNVGAPELRRWLADNRWRIVEEALVEEASIIYEVIVAEPGPAEPLDAIAALLGPELLRQRPPLLARQVDKLIGERQYVLQQLSRASSAEAVAKRQRLQIEIGQLEAVLK